RCAPPRAARRAPRRAGASGLRSGPCDPSLVHALAVGSVGAGLMRAEAQPPAHAVVLQDYLADAAPARHAARGLFLRVGLVGDPVGVALEAVPREELPDLEAVVVGLGARKRRQKQLGEALPGVPLRELDLPVAKYVATLRGVERA